MQELGKQGQEDTNRDETHLWQETMFLRVFGESVSFGYCERAKQPYVCTSLWKTDAMSKSPRILFQSVFFSSAVLGSKMLWFSSLKAVLPLWMFASHRSKLWAGRLMFFVIHHLVICCAGLASEDSQRGLHHFPNFWRSLSFPSKRDSLECRLFRSGVFFACSFYQNSLISVYYFFSLLFPLLWGVPLPSSP